jgi:molybdate/tungstate transport system substrate-binding protein
MRKWLLILLVVMVAVAGCGGRKKRVVIFHADALTVPIGDIIAEYEQLHPNVRILAESHGSVTCSHLAKERACDILMVADARIIAEMEPQYAEWNAIFATNEMVIAYAQKSKFGAEINPQNWYEVLTRPGVTFAHSNPKYDPCGYWTLIVWELADLHYGATVNDKPISEALKAARTQDSIKSDAHQMLNLIDSPSGIDYAFVYMNQAVEQNLKMVRLPKEINLSDPALAEFYSKAHITEPIEKTGAPIAFSLTLLKKAPQREEAIEFLKFALGERGRALLRGDRAVAAFNVTHPPLVDNPDKVPPGLAEVMGLEH